MKKFISLILTSILPFIAFAQLQGDWTNLIEFNQNSSVNLILDHQENVIVLGANKILKYSISGEEIWKKEILGQAYSPAPGGNGKHIEIDSQNNIYALHNKINFDNYVDSLDEVILITKYSSSGDSLWRTAFKYYDNLSKNKGSYIKYHKNRIYITGYVKDSISGFDFFLNCYNSTTGDLIWKNQKLNNTNDNIGQIIEIDSEDNVYVGGRKNLGHQVVKFNDNGEFLWNSTYHNDNFLTNFVTDMAVTDNNNLVVVGYHYITSSFDSNGDLSWNYTPFSILPYNISGQPIKDIINIENDVVVTGNHAEYYDENTGERDYDMVTNKYDENGIKVWSNRFKLNDAEFQFGNSLCKDQFNNIYVAGYQSTIDSSNSVIIKIDSDTGESMWEFKDEELGYPRTKLYSIKISNSGSIYVIGGIYENIDISHIYVKKFNAITSNIKTTESTSQNFRVIPNPTINGLFKIKTTNTNNPYSSITIYNQIGKNVLFKKALIEGENIDVSDLPSGIYFIRIETNGKSIIKKLIVNRN